MKSSIQLTNQETSEFYLGCITKGEEEYAKFKSERLEDKKVKLFDVIPKVRKKKKINGISQVDLKKETVSFVRHIDFAKLREYNIQQLLQYEITFTSFFLTKDGYLRKSQKSQLTQEIKKLLPTPCPEVVPIHSEPYMVVFDFMGYCRKVPIKKIELKTYADLASHLWTTFTSLSKQCSRLDIVFDLYLDASIKEEERLRRSKDMAIEVNISSYNQVSYFQCMVFPTTKYFIYHTSIKLI